MALEKANFLLKTGKEADGTIVRPKFPESLLSPPPAGGSRHLPSVCLRPNGADRHAEPFTPILPG